MAWSLLAQELMRNNAATLRSAPDRTNSNSQKVYCPGSVPEREGIEADAAVIGIDTFAALQESDHGIGEGRGERLIGGFHQPLGYDGAEQDRQGHLAPEGDGYEHRRIEPLPHQRRGDGPGPEMASRHGEL